MVWQCNIPALDVLGFEKAPETVDEFNAVIAAFSEKKDELGDWGNTYILSSIIN